MFTMGIDQYGYHHDDLGKHPRKELMRRLGRASARKMYHDDKNGNVKHIGYIVSGLWVRLYTVTPLDR
jgi:hypothetical protein